MEAGFQRSQVIHAIVPCFPRLTRPFDPLFLRSWLLARSFVNFVDPNDVENDALLSFSWSDLRPNSLFRLVIGFASGFKLVNARRTGSLFS